MATPTKYDFSVSGDFSAGIATAKLSAEIRSAGDIYHALDSITVVGDSVSVLFKDAIDAIEQVALNNLIAAHDGVPELKTDKVEITNHVKSETVPTQGSRVNFITHNLAEKTTWYTDSARIEEEIITDSGDGLTWNTIHKPIVDLAHGKVFGEHDKKDALGNSYRCVVTSDGVSLSEKDKHTGIGDYSVDYHNGAVTFDVSQAGKQVKMTYYKVQSSNFIIAPAPGKVLTVTKVETQFSEDYLVNDSVHFQVRGPVDFFAPQLLQANGGPFPSGHLIDLASPTIYNTSQDYIRESNGSFPMIPASTHPDAPGNWRMGSKGTLGYPWIYEAGIQLKGSVGMQIHVFLEHDEAFSGEEATATLYCLTEDE